MSIWKIISGVLSILLFGFVVFQSFIAGMINAFSGNGQVSGTAGLIVAAMLLTGGIVSIATRNAVSNAGNVALIILYGAAAIAGFLMAGSYGDLVLWATWCLLCAVVAAMAIAADNICGALVYVLIAVVGIAIGAVGWGMNLGDSEAQKPAGGGKDVVQGADDESKDSEEDNNGGDGNQEAHTNTGAGDLGNFHVEIKGAKLGEDYDGEKVIIVTYTWTNNSENTTSAMVSTSEKAFQDGVELDRAITVNDVDFSGNSKDVRPGYSIDVNCAYILTSDTATVEFEVTEWISFTDDVVTMDFDPANLS